METHVGFERFTEYAHSKYEGDLVVRRLYWKKWLPVVLVYPGVVLGASVPRAMGQYTRDLN